MNIRHLPLRAATALALIVSLPSFVVAAEQAAGPGSTLNAPEQRSRYTEDEARIIMASHGYNGVGRLQLDDKLVWRGTAIQYGEISKVAVDDRGNFTARKK